MNKNNKGGRRSRRFNKQTNNVSSSKELTCRASGRERAYQIETINGTAGVLLPDTGVAATTDTGGRYTIILPASIGPRCAQLARLYNEYKVNRCTFHYAPNSYQLGTQSLSTITPFQGNAFAGVTLDPTVGLLTQSELIEAGGKVFNFARPHNIVLGRTQWLYTEPRVSDTLSDNRFISPGILNFQTNFNGGVTPIKLGELWVEWDISFRFPVDADTELSARIPPASGKELLNLLKSVTLAQPVLRRAEESKEDEYDLVRIVKKKL